MAGWPRRLFRCRLTASQSAPKFSVPAAGRRPLQRSALSIRQCLSVPSPHNTQGPICSRGSIPRLSSVAIGVRGDSGRRRCGLLLPHGTARERALAHLREHRTERLEPILNRYGGRLVKLAGDGALVEFASAVDALSAAI